MALAMPKASDNRPLPFALFTRARYSLSHATQLISLIARPQAFGMIPRGNHERTLNYGDNLDVLRRDGTGVT